MSHGKRKSILLGSLLVFCLLFLTVPAQAMNSLKFTSVNEQYGLFDITNHGGTFVVVGTEGLIKTSTDGINWTQRDSGTKEYLYAVKWLGGQYICVGTFGTILTSKDGTAWEKRDSGTYFHLDGISWNGVRYVVVGYQSVSSDLSDLDNYSSIVLTSKDGVNWSEVGSDFKGVFSAVSWGENRFVAVATNGAIYTSADGETWVENTFLAYGGIYSIACSGTKFVATAGGGNILVSKDGLNWRSTNWGMDVALDCVTWTGENFLILSGGDIFKSIDGDQWEMITQEPLVDNEENYFDYLRAIASYEDTYVTIGSGGDVFVSSDGNNWECLKETFIMGSFKDIEWSSKQFVAVGKGGCIFTSNDGMNWTEQDSGTEEELRAVAWDGQRFVTAGDGLVLASEDGIVWEQIASINADFLHEILWANGTYVIIDSYGHILTSNDGVLWTKQSMGDKHPLFDITWDGRQFVIVGSDMILTSKDGVDWVKQLISVSGGLYGIVWNGQQFIAVGYNAILRSSDGINWQGEQRTEYGYLHDVIWDGREFIANDDLGHTMISTDGKQWQKNAFGIPCKTIWNGYRFVGVGGGAVGISTAVPTDLIKVVANGTPIIFDVAPVSLGGRTMVPLRGIFEALGADVKWDAATRSIDAQKGDIKIHLQLDNKTATVNGKAVALDAAPCSLSGRTMVPLRFIGEAFDCEVTWQADTKTVVIENQ